MLQGAPSGGLHWSAPKEEDYWGRPGETGGDRGRLGEAGGDRGRPGKTGGYMLAIAWVLSVNVLILQLVARKHYPISMLIPQFVAGEHRLFGGHESEDILTICLIF